MASDHDEGLNTIRRHVAELAYECGDGEDGAESEADVVVAMVERYARARFEAGAVAAVEALEGRGLVIDDDPPFGWSDSLSTQSGNVRRLSDAEKTKAATRYAKALGVLGEEGGSDVPSDWTSIMDGLPDENGGDIAYICAPSWAEDPAKEAYVMIDGAHTKWHEAVHDNYVAWQPLELPALPDADELARLIERAESAAAREGEDV